MRAVAGRMAVALGMVAGLALPPAVEGAVWYVDAGAAPGGDGLSWATAFRFLQDPLVHPDLSFGDQIWVAAGTYYPDQYATSPEGTDDPDATFELVAGVRMYGGFPPEGGDGTFAARDLSEFETVLCGDFFEPPDLVFDLCVQPQAGTGDCFTETPGVPGCIDPECCAFVCDALPFCCVNDWNWQCALAATEICTGLRAVHVVNAYGVGTDARLDGLTIRGGAAVLADEPYSYYRDVGGGMLIRSSDLVVANCTFESNSATGGGALAIVSVYSDPLVVNCRFLGNQADDGGAVYVDYGGPVFANCLFRSNIALNGSGGAVYGSPDTELINCTLIDNLAIGHGSATYDVPVIANSIFWGNGASPLFGADEVTYSLVEDGYPGQGNMGGPPMFVDPQDRDYRLSYQSPCVDWGSTEALPDDLADLDRDLDLDEPTSLDFDLHPRVVNGTVDMGAYEYCAFDLTADGIIDVGDLLALLSAWGTQTDGPPDFDGDGFVGVADLFALLVALGPCA